MGSPGARPPLSQLPLLQLFLLFGKGRREQWLLLCQNTHPSPDP